MLRMYARTYDSRRRHQGSGPQDHSMEKFSVKKPFTVLVAVLIILILGIVSVTRIPTDLLPSISLPYMIVVTPYPGASPERVEMNVTVPMERALGTVSHVKNVTSTSAENYSMVQLEFEDGTDMDSAMVKVSSSVEQVRANLPQECGTPSILEISMDMIATMYLAVSRDGYDIYELSEFIDDDVVPYFERQEGVASVNTIGLVQKSVQVDLNAEKIQALNDRILEKTNDSLAEARAQLDDAKKQVEDGQNELESQERRFGSTMASGMMSQIAPQSEEIRVQLKEAIENMYQRINSFKGSMGSMDGIGKGLAGDIGGAMQNFQNAYWEAFYDYFRVQNANRNAEKVFEKTAEEMEEEIEKALEEKEKAEPEEDTPAQDDGQEQPPAGDTPVTEQPQPAPEQQQPAPEQPQPSLEQSQPVPEQPQPVPEQPQPVPEQPQPAPEQPQPAPEQQSSPEAGSQDTQNTVPAAEPAAPETQPAPEGTAEQETQPAPAMDGETAPEAPSAAAEPAAPESGAEEVPAGQEEITPAQQTGTDVGTSGRYGGTVKDSSLGRSIAADKPSDTVIFRMSSTRLIVGGILKDTDGPEAGDGSREGTDDPAESNSEDETDELPEDMPEELREQLEDAYDDFETALNAANDYLSREEVNARLESALRDLDNAYQCLDGGSIASITAGISNLVGAEAKIQTLMQQVQAADTGKALEDPVRRINEALQQINEGVDKMPEMMASLQQGLSMLTQGQLDAAVGFSQAATGLYTMQQQLEQASAQYENARTEALKSANIDTLVTAQTLSQLIYAQNFSMPAGYIDDKEDRSWLLKVGEEFDTSEDLAGALLADIDGIGTIRLEDVADITVIDNAGVSYTRLNGQNGVVVSVYKSSTASTSDVSEACRKAIGELKEDKPGTNIVILMDQGSYIGLIVRDILSSMALGALLAVIVLALFLRDVRPTIMVGISIPLSVLFTMVLMYFSDLSLNIMTMAGISLGIGMLVDNSIVVMENIIRLRQRGLPAPRASVQGAKQVSGSIIASTLTTICVFLPMVFTTGTVRELLLPMALSITYCLTASLIVAMTVIPASASVILRHVRPKRRSVFDRILNVYGDTLSWSLQHKAIVLIVTVGLLAFCIWRLAVMGIVMLPEMTSDNIEVDITTPEGLEREESYELTDKIGERIRNIEGVSDVGIMDMSSASGLISAMTTRSGGYGSYMSYVIAEDTSAGNIRRISDEIREATEDVLGTVDVATSAMGDMSAFMSSGLSLNVYGSDLDMLYNVSDRVIASVKDVKGFDNARSSAGAQEQSLLLHIDKDKAMSLGLTVAQIYAEIASRMQTEVTSTTITTDGITLTVNVRDETKPLTRENLLDIEFKTTPMFAQFGGASDTEDAEATDTADTADTNASEANTADSSEEDAMGSGLAQMMAAFSRTSAAPAEEIHKLSEFATVEETLSPLSITRENQSRYITVRADTLEGYNTTLLARELEDSVSRINDSLPNGYSVEIGGESSQVNEMIEQMAKMLLLALAFIYLVMVAQFQSLLSPFIILFTVPLAFTGGMIALLVTREQLSMLALMGFLVLMGTVVNNGIVFVDYTNQLRIGGLERRHALVAAGRTRMRPILMTALTTILAMTQLIFGEGMGAQISRAMALVISGGLIYATLMTLYIVPVIYDILYKKQPLSVDVGSDIDDVPDDAAEFIAGMTDTDRKAGPDENAYPEEEMYLEEEMYPEDGMYPEEEMYPDDEVYPEDKEYPEDKIYPENEEYPEEEADLSGDGSVPEEERANAYDDADWPSDGDWDEGFVDMDTRELL